MCAEVDMTLKRGRAVMDERGHLSRRSMQLHGSFTLYKGMMAVSSGMVGAMS